MTIYTIKDVCYVGSLLALDESSHCNEVSMAATLIADIVERTVWMDFELYET